MQNINKTLETEEPYKLRVKPITTPKKAPSSQQIRDTFQTPNYATDLIIPYIPKDVNMIWECAAGKKKISNKLESNGYSVLSTDLVESDGVSKFNFINDHMDFEDGKKFQL